LEVITQSSGSTAKPKSPISGEAKLAFDNFDWKSLSKLPAYSSKKRQNYLKWILKNPEPLLGHADRNQEIDIVRRHPALTYYPILVRSFVNKGTLVFFNEESSANVLEQSNAMVSGGNTIDVCDQPSCTLSRFNAGKGRNCFLSSIASKFWKRSLSQVPSIATKLTDEYQRTVRFDGGGCGGRQDQ
jgi:hypothetical protein